MHQRDGPLGPPLRFQVSGSGGPSRTSLWWRPAALLLAAWAASGSKSIVPVRTGVSGLPLQCALKLYAVQKFFD